LARNGTSSTVFDGLPAPQQAECQAIVWLIPYSEVHDEQAADLTPACFGYGDTQVGPGPLDVSGCTQATSLEEVLELVLLEGCLGESAAARAQ
jgi:hypothetical protein